MSILVGRQAPDFNACAVMGNGDINECYTLSEAIKGRYGLLFFYPLDFTFVCPSELIALERRFEDFVKRDTEVIAVSIDSQFTHAAWRNTPIKQGGIGPVRYNMVADVSHDVCRAYGVEHFQARVALRGTFLIDKDFVVRSQTVNDLPLGRNIDESLRLIDALQFHEKHGDVCPAGWNVGDPGMQPTAKGVATYLEAESENL